MTHKELCMALMRGWPGARWSAPGAAVSLEDVEWLDGSPKPTQAELEAVGAQPVPERAAREKLATLASAYGLTVAELKAELAK